MKLNYKIEQTNLGGSAVPDCGTIHISELYPTLEKLSKDIDCPLDLIEYLLGSTGKKEYSGDIDLVVDKNWFNDTPAKFAEMLENKLSVPVKRIGEMVHIKYPIVGYNTTFNKALPRTGFIQIDFNFGDLDWERVYHHSPGEDSSYKGAHRNLLLAGITSAVNTVNSREKDTWNRPIHQTRWLWSPHGFVKVERSGLKHPQTKTWLKKRKDVILEGPYFTAKEIAEILFENGKEEDLYSFETLMEAVKRSYGAVDQERIWKRTAYNFAGWKDGKNFNYPPEIAEYIDDSDK